MSGGGAGRRARQAATALQRRLYPPDRPARDVLRGVARDQALVVAPASARLAWWAVRLMPSAGVAAAARAARAAHRPRD
jgi:hypothetical protein